MFTACKYSLPLERCIRDCVAACRELGKVVKNTTLQQSPKDTEWLTKLRCYSLRPSPIVELVSSVLHVTHEMKQEARWSKIEGQFCFEMEIDDSRERRNFITERRFRHTAEKSKIPASAREQHVDRPSHNGRIIGELGLQVHARSVGWTSGQVR
ncbi:hypothetical protein BDR03DRAFT_995880 [Suillus americanus]|nr:hypothetical protein BDR03DRAFT_995880 [Suillus americanus]